MKRGELIYSRAEIDGPAGFLCDLLGEVKIITFSGMLGAGKTTLVQHILRRAGVEEVVQSPTFTYVTYYTGLHGRRYYHFDLYRLTSCAEFIDAGFADYLGEENSYALIEWPEIIAPLLKTNLCFVALDHVSEDTRKMRYEIVRESTR